MAWMAGCPSASPTAMSASMQPASVSIRRSGWPWPPGRNPVTAAKVTYVTPDRGCDPSLRLRQRVQKIAAISLPRQKAWSLRPAGPGGPADQVVQIAGQCAHPPVSGRIRQVSRMRGGVRLAQPVPAVLVDQGNPPAGTASSCCVPQQQSGRQGAAGASADDRDDRPAPVRRLKATGGRAGNLRGGGGRTAPSSPTGPARRGRAVPRTGCPAAGCRSARAACGRCTRCGTARACGRSGSPARRTSAARTAARRASR